MFIRHKSWDKSYTRDLVINYLLGYMSGTLQAVYTCDSLPKDIKLICEQAQQKYVELIKEING